MPAEWKAPDLAETWRAVTEAVDDLEVMRREIAEAEAESPATVRTRLLKATYWGDLAATRKRLAELQFLNDEDGWRVTLAQALNDYDEALREGIQVDHWILGQSLVLRAVLNLGDGPSVDLTQSDDWTAAQRSVRLALNNPSLEEQMWARSSMADLVMVGHTGESMTELKGSMDVLDELSEMVRAGGGPQACKALWPTFRQFWRWHRWWRPAPWDAAAKVGYDYLWELVRPRLEPDTPAATSSPEKPLEPGPIDRGVATDRGVPNQLERAPRQ
jgi:hypothetical protein